MGNKIGSNWIVDSVSPEGAEEWIAESANVVVARAAYDEALKHRPGRVVRFRHGPQILTTQIGWRCDWWLEKTEPCGCPTCVANREQ